MCLGLKVGEKETREDIRDSPWTQGCRRRKAGARLVPAEVQPRGLRQAAPPSWGRRPLAGSWWNWHLCRAHRPIRGEQGPARDRCRREERDADQRAENADFRSRLRSAEVPGSTCSGVFSVSQWVGGGRTDRQEQRTGNPNFKKSFKKFAQCL